MLCEAGWVRLRDNHKISLHPLIRTVVFYEKETQLTWCKIEHFAASLLEKCKYTDVSFFSAENFREFPATSVYMCLSNITQLCDIPDVWAADIFETLAWELYFINGSTGIDFLTRYILLNAALTCRENILETDTVSSDGKIKTDTQNISALAGVWFKIGCLCANQFDHHEDACEAFCKAADILSDCQIPNYFLVADCYGYAAYAYCQLEEFDQAIQHLQMARDAFQKADTICCDLYYPDSLPPTCFGFSYPDAIPQEVACYYKHNEEYWNFSYIMTLIRNKFPFSPARFVRIDPNH